MTSLVERSPIVVVLKNAVALHGVGRARFSAVPAIHDSKDAYDMIAEMRRIIASTPTSEEERVTQERVISFFHDHDIKE